MMSFHRLLAPPHSPISSRRRRRKYAHPPSTPPLHWKLFFDSPRRNNNGGAKVASARKLAAGLWQLQSAAGGGKVARLKPERGSCGDVVGIQPSMCPAPCGSGTTAGYHEDNKDDGLLRPHVSSDLRHGVLRDKSWRKAMAKRDIATLYNEAHCFYARLKIIDQQHDEPLQISHASALQSRLSHARFRINELESERRGYRKRVGHLFRELEEERRMWRAKEENKLRAVFEGLKDELGRERKSRKKMEVLNARLVEELSDVRSRAERFRKVYWKEKKSREVVEVVCSELATRVGEQKEEFEELRRDSIRFEAEIEEERRMMQMVELWREERVQMKLNDAKFALESKYDEMLTLISQLDALLMSGSATSIDAIEPSRSEEVKEVAKRLQSNVSEDDEFVHEPHASRDLYTVLEEIGGVGGKVGVTQACNDRTVSLTNGFDSRHDTSSKGSNCSLEESEHHANMLVCDDQVERTVQEVPLVRPDAPAVDGFRDQGCVGEWNLNELMNPHITRGIKGRVEWPRGSRKFITSKAKGSQARMERQKAKLRSVVKHRSIHQ
ncbi:unnamed protein product [Linum trigynum]|uniref:Uncharacterized protein n=1 Tax=Linum trigynum TaxID=586398 RepID=A0AAV2FIE6_9ROSI